MGLWHSLCGLPCLVAVLFALDYATSSSFSSCFIPSPSDVDWSGSGMQWSGVGSVAVFALVPPLARKLDSHPSHPIPARPTCQEPRADPHPKKRIAKSRSHDMLAVGGSNMMWLMMWLESVAS